MNRQEKNIEIAKILGFKFHKDGQVTYPPDWIEYRVSIPCTYIPDFIEMFNQVRTISSSFRYGIPRDFDAVNHIIKDEN